MKITDTISVNPSKNALGHVESPSSTIFRTPVAGVSSESHSVDLLKLVFPATGAGISEYKKYEVPLRTLFATILIVTGISLLSVSAGMHSIGFAVCALCFGAFLALGLFTRPVMIGAAVFYCISGALSLRAHTPDIAVFSLMFGCLIFGILGAGKYSCDTIIRSAILRHKKVATLKSKENYLGYKAFHKVNY